jgi:hypothetical protein
MLGGRNKGDARKREASKRGQRRKEKGGGWIPIPTLFVRMLLQLIVSL